MTDIRGTRPAEAELLRVATSLFAERGYHGTSMRAVSAGVGLSLPSLYHYFGSKQLLLMAILETTMRDLFDAVEAEVEEADGPAEALRAGIRRNVVLHAERQEEMFVADAELRAVEPQNRPLILKLRDDYEQLFRARLEEGCEAGIFSIADVGVVTRALMSMCVGVAQWYRPDGPLSLEAIAEVYADLFLDGITGPRRPVAAPNTTRRGGTHAT